MGYENARKCVHVKEMNEYSFIRFAAGASAAICLSRLGHFTLLGFFRAWREAGVSWKRYGEAGSMPPGNWVKATAVEEVYGLKYRQANVRAFCTAVAMAERKGLHYGLALAPQPDNPDDPSAIAILGQAFEKRWFRSERLREWHIGYVRRQLAKEIYEEFLSKSIPIASQLRNIYESGRYIEINYFVLAPPGNSFSSRVRQGRTKRREE